MACGDQQCSLCFTHTLPANKRGTSNDLHQERKSVCLTVCVCAGLLLLFILNMVPSVAKHTAQHVCVCACVLACVCASLDNYTVDLSWCSRYRSVFIWSSADGACCLWKVFMLCTADVPHHVLGYFKAIVVCLTCGFQIYRHQIHMHSARQVFFLPDFLPKSPTVGDIFWWRAIRSNLEYDHIGFNFYSLLCALIPVINMEFGVDLQKERSQKQQTAVW